MTGQRGSGACHWSRSIITESAPEAAATGGGATGGVGMSGDTGLRVGPAGPRWTACLNRLTGSRRHRTLPGMTGDSERWRLGHRAALDGVRGVAIMLVLMAHFDRGGLTAAGVMGVKVFFALSGFLITSLLLEERAVRDRVDLRRFYLRRALRLLPALATMVFIVAAAAAAGWPLSVRPGVALAALGYVSNWYLLAEGWESTDFVFRSLGHTWSLSIEEQFYLVWPMVLIGAAAWRGRRAACLVAGLGATLSLGSWALTGRSALASDVSAWCLLAGCLLALAMHRRVVRSPSPLWAAPLLVLFPLGTVSGFGIGWGHLIAPLVTLSALWVGAQRRVAWLELGWLRWLGQRSYGLYLWHVPISQIAGRLPVPYPMIVVIGIALSLLATEVSWRLVETPFLRLKSRVTGGRGELEPQSNR